MLTECRRRAVKVVAALRHEQTVGLAPSRLRLGLRRQP